LSKPTFGTAYTNYQQQHSGQNRVTRRSGLLLRHGCTLLESQSYVNFKGLLYLEAKSREVALSSCGSRLTRMPFIRRYPVQVGDYFRLCRHVPASGPRKTLATVYQCLWSTKVCGSRGRPVG
jgi:hypothetical protein